jgi:hypothetical protein
MVGEVSEAGGKLRAFSIGTPHADTGVREIRELISSGKAFAVLTAISHTPQIARGCNEGDMSETIAEKVNQMTKIVMAATADAWLVHLPGFARRHEIFTAAQLEQDSANVDDLVTSLQDPEDDCPAGHLDHSLSQCLFAGIEGLSMDGEPRISLSLLYRKLEKMASTRECSRIPLLVQTQARKGELPIARETRKRMHSPNVGRKEKVDAVSAKQRQSPLSSWIGKQLLGQKIPKRYLDGEGNLQMILYPSEGIANTDCYGYPQKIFR